MRAKPVSVWIQISLFNLMIVALFGALMRYKIGFEFPFFQQKFLLHAHSHFAFAGWVMHTLITLMAFFINGTENTNRYRNLIIANLICAWGMLISFSVQGYAAVSITFSTLSIFIAWFFTGYFISDLKKHFADHPSRPWFTAALIFGVISAAGTFYLAWMMKSGTFDLNFYLGSVYYYLHFQYNGWFFFACMGLFIAWVRKVIPDFRFNPVTFKYFAATCIPAYFLSVLWAGFPDWLYFIIAAAAIFQVVAWIYFLKDVKKLLPLLKTYTDITGRFLLLFIALCVTVKVGLQLFSTVPAISQLAFGFRPIVIAYLHLVLLAIISVFLLTYAYINGNLLHNKIIKTGLLTFLSGVFLNEFVLLIQGIGSFSYSVLPFTNEMLFFVSLWMLTGSALMIISQISAKRPVNAELP